MCKLLVFYFFDKKSFCLQFSDQTFALTVGCEVTLVAHWFTWPEFLHPPKLFSAASFSNASFSFGHSFGNQIP